MDKIHNKHFIPIILVPLILFSPLVVSGKALFWGTTSTQFVPWWDFAWETVLKGQLPLWNPWVGMGAPLIANYQSALFYPPYWITLLAYFFGGTQWMAWSISLVVVFHLIWSGIGTAKLLEELNTGKLGQAIGGMAFSLSGYLVARAGFLSINAAAAWLPWILLYVARLTIEKKGSFWALVLVFSFQLLAGHAQTTWYSILLGGIWLIFKLITTGNVVEGWKKNIMCLLQFIAAGILSTGISAVQLIPTIEYLFQSQRVGEYGYVEAMTYSFWPWRFLTVFVPDLFGSPASGNYWGYGNYWEDAVYIGLVPILLALGLIFRVLFGRKKEILSKNYIEVHHTVYFLICITGVSFLFALGKNTSIFPFLYRNIPTFDLFQAPTRFSIWAVMALSIMAGMGVDQIEIPVGRKKYWTRLAAAGCVAIVGGSILGGYVLHDIKTTFIFPIGRAGLLGLGAAVISLTKPHRDQELKIKIWSVLLVGLVSLDLLVAGWGLNPGIEMDFYRKPEKAVHTGRLYMPANVEYELKFNRFFKFDSFSPDLKWQDMHKAKLPNLTMLQRVEMVNNFDPLLPGRYQTWIEELNKLDQKSRNSILDMMGVSTIVDLTENGVVENEINLAPEIVRINRAIYVSGGDAEILNLLMEGEIDNKKEMILTVTDSFRSDQCGGSLEGEVGVLEQRPGYIKLISEVDEKSWIFWSQSWYPGWKAIIDGEETVDIQRSNFVFQAVCVPAGIHEIEFIYQPNSFKIGMVVSMISIVTMLVCVIFQRRNNQE